MSAAATNPYVKRLEDLEREVAELKRIVGAIGAVFTGGGQEVADDDELDSKFGDPIIKKDPTERFWKGSGFVGKHLSECSPEYLDALAKYKDVCAKLKEKDGSEAKKKYAAYDRADAARARGWARRLRAGWTPPEKPVSHGFGTNGTPANPYATGTNPFAKSNGFGARAMTPPVDDRDPSLGDAFEPEEEEEELLPTSEIVSPPSTSGEWKGPDK